MKEIRRIISAFEKLDRSGEYGILASVVYTSGSTYRRPGARAFILPDDTMLGLVGGGCLEADLLAEQSAFITTIPPMPILFGAWG